MQSMQAPTCYIAAHAAGTAKLLHVTASHSIPQREGIYADP